MPTVLHSGNYILDGNPVLGPDNIVFQEKSVVGLRLDGIPQKQGYNAMEWRYSTVPGDEMRLLQAAWVTTRGQGLVITFINKLGVVETGRYYMQQPVIGKRRMFVYDSVVIRFTATYRTGIAPNTPLQAGTSAGFDRFLNGEVFPVGIASVEAFGIPVFTIIRRVYPTAIASAGAFGTLRISRNVLPTSIASAEALGSPTFTIVFRVFPVAIASSEALGVPSVSRSMVLASIVSAGSVGSPSISRSVLPASITSGEALGVVIVTNALRMYPASIVSGEAFGSPSVSRTVAPTGIVSSETFGTPQVGFPGAGPTADGITTESGDFLTTEDGYYLILE